MPKEQSAICLRPVNAAIRLNPQSAPRNTQHRFRRSEVEPCGPRSGLEIGPRGFRGASSAPHFVRTSNLPMKTRSDG
eukprot:15445946-Alexandrium_andersonii.AAC.1